MKLHVFVTSPEVQVEIDEEVLKVKPNLESVLLYLQSQTKNELTNRKHFRVLAEDLMRIVDWYLENKRQPDYSDDPFQGQR